MQSITNNKRKTKLAGIATAVCCLICCISPVQVQAANPFLPLWERIPDGEPHIFTDPETGEERVYVYGSHDTTGFFCGDDYVVWSAPVNDLSDWRHEGVSFRTTDMEGISYTDPDGSQRTLEVAPEHLLYAPDVMYYPADDTYYLFGFLAEGDPKSLMFTASSDSPAGPFTDPHFLGWGFDPAVLVDDTLNDEGKERAYLYYSDEASRAVYACELDTDTMKIMPETIHSPRVNQTVEEKNTMFGNSDDPFCFFEGASIRKIDETYVLSYARSVDKGLAEIGYATSDNPFGDPSLGKEWKYGGVIIANNGELIQDPYEENTETYTYYGGNNHGGLVQIDGQWYQFFHRSTNLKFKRQAMVTAVNVHYNEQGELVIDQAELTSEGFEIDGLDPYEEHYAAIACYTLPSDRSGTYMESNNDLNFDPKADHGDWYPVKNIKDRSWVGYKYFNFGEEAADDNELNLILTLTESIPATVNIYTGSAKESSSEQEDEKEFIGTMKLTGEDHEVHTVEASIENLTGKKAIYLEFLADSPTEEAANQEICELNKLQFVRK